MRLLHTTELRFEEFFESEVPKYAILSHRWISGQEVSYEDFLLKNKPDATGWEKIRWFAGVARDVHHCEWCWVDTYVELLGRKTFGLVLMIFSDNRSGHVC